ncbi:MAG: sensor domain-containing diguanylate cyclase [Angelakisella sp.]
MNENVARGVIGITDAGQPIVTADYQCPHFSEQSVRLIGTQECWYCQFADFRKSYEITLHQSICRCPQNRVRVVEDGKNEQQPSAQVEQFVSNIKGGIITCIFCNETQSSKAVYINAGWTAITGYTLEELNQKMDGNPQALVYPEDKAAADLEYNRQVKIGNEYTLVYRVVNKGGATIWVIDRGVVSVLPNGDIQNQSIVTEVTEIKRQEEQLRKLAQIDQLTGLYNKMTFAQQVRTILAGQHNKLHAMMILDIDNFKSVNDSMGHAYGDKVLEAVSSCLKGLFRNRDVLGRIGGDEFMILMEDIPSPKIAHEKAVEVCAAIHGIQIHMGKEFPITVSVGVAISADNLEYEDIFRQADAALYQAKSNGKNQAAFGTAVLANKGAIP